MGHRIRGHDDVVGRFRRAAERGRVAGTYLFVGTEGIGKRSLAIQLAKALLCPEEADTKLTACNACASCRLVETGAHPDLELIAGRADRQVFTIDLLIGDQNHRNNEGLLRRIALKPSLARRKVAILDDADRFNLESANALLKLLEEPPPGAVIFLIGTSGHRQLPTVRSRAQIVRFRPLSAATITELLLEKGIVDDPARAEELSAVSGGSLSEACRLADAALWEFRGRMHRWLDERPLDGVRTGRAVAKFVDAAGREARDRRNRLRQVIRFAVDYYRDILRTRPAPDSPEADEALFRLDRCLDAFGHVDRNANLATLIDWWTDELARV